MGRVLYMVKRTGKFFFGLDGGSNGYDQTFNHEFYKEFNPKTQFALHFSDKSMYTFPEVLRILKVKGWFQELLEKMIQMPRGWETPTMKQLREAREARVAEHAAQADADAAVVDLVLPRRTGLRSQKRQRANSH